MKCKTKNCRKDSAPKRRVCYSCAVKGYKDRNPVRYAYAVMKGNAKRRKKVFNISFEYFKQFVISSSYMAGKGINKAGLHIDRIKEELGYIEGNLQVLTNTENVKKYLSYQFDKTGKPENYRIKKSLTISDPDSPF
jgi:hypothetical protein